MVDLDAAVSWMVFAPLGVALGLAVLTALARLAGYDLPGKVWMGIGVGGPLFSAALAFWIWLEFDPAAAVEYQYLEFVPWIPELGIHYFVGIDGFSLPMIGLTTLLVLIVLVASLDAVRDRLRTWVFCILTLETALIGAFASLNILQFMVFWQWALFAAAFAIGIWGRTARVPAALKFLGMGTAGVMATGLAALVAQQLHLEQFGLVTFDLVDGSGAGAALLDTVIPVGGGFRSQLFLFAAFAVAFAISSALAPLHLWLADAHGEAPTGASILIAGAGVNLGIYALLRFALPLFPVAAVELSVPIMALASAGVLYGALLAMVQADLKRALAYASMCQLGLASLGLFAFNVAGLEGGVLQLLHHGMALPALFLLAGMLESRRETLRLDAFGGITKPMPVFAVLLGVSVLATIGMPLLSGFVGQFLVLLGAFDVAPRLSLVALLGASVLAVSLLWVYRRVALGDVENPENRGLIDLGWRERLVVLALVLPMFGLGIQPETLTSRLHQPVLTLRRVMLDRAAATHDLHPDRRASDAIERLSDRHGRAKATPGDLVQNQAMGHGLATDPRDD
jgi:NADH-quinone oxidoreductase subunit M